MSASREATIQGRDRSSARLLPLSKDPFQAPTDRDMLPSERRPFVRTQFFEAKLGTKGTHP